MRKTKISIAAVVAAIGLAWMPACPAIAGSAPQWQAYYYVPSLDALHVSPAGTSATFSFPAGSYAARMTTSDQSFIGDRLGRAVSAMVEVTGLTGSWTYNGEGASWNPCGTPATVRLFFTSDSEAAGVPQVPYQAGGPGYPGVVYTHYWWSNPASVTMSQISGGEMQITAVLTPGQWSDWDGQVGSSVPDAFNAAASGISSIGVSFGGGCFFENGVTTTDGSGQFRLSSFSD